MVEKTITQQKKQREQWAVRSARYREIRKRRPDVRAVDKALSEAVAVYARTLTPDASKAFLAAITALAAKGLEYQGYGPTSSNVRTVRRLASWIAAKPSSGGVRAAFERAATVTASRPDPEDTPVTSSDAVTEPEAA